MCARSHIYLEAHICAHRGGLGVPRYARDYYGARLICHGLHDLSL